VQTSFEASLIPAIDSLRSLGIVWIPGLMAGMLLSGARPVYAAVYQFVVVAMISAERRCGCRAELQTEQRLNQFPARTKRSPQCYVLFPAMLFTIG
jgi:putative ABC transport system permease protein